jgi:DMSO/TMAO reductase YedYZ molybdopterin-dependent catalytic subunit
MSLTRRDFVRTALAAPLFAGWTRAEEHSFPGMIVRAHQPRNLEFPVSELRDAIIPNEQFFVRSHFAVPEMNAKTWKLTVEGAVDKPFELTIDEIAKLPTSKLTATIECAGNSRVNLTPAVPGLQWGQGGVGNAVWEGIPLGEILERAGAKKSAVDVILEGTDEGTINSDPKSPGTIHFARSLPVEKSKSAQVILAHKMNGETLPLSHGFPMRAVVGGWYGMASVKWLKRIIVSEKPFGGFFQTLDYSYFVRRDGQPTLLPVTAIEPKALLARPSLSEVIPAGKPYRLFGAAWAGENAVKKVEVSLDGGKTWAAAKLLAEPKPIQWVLWEYAWENPSRGEASILVKATDDKDRTQPATRDPDRRQYMINHLVPVAVTVR